MVLLGLILIFIILNFIFPLPEVKSFSKEILASDTSLLSAYLTEDDKWRMKAEISDFSPDLIKSIIAKEDKYFYWHIGFNPFSILRALYSNISSSKIVSGASTITMQLARLWDPAERNYYNKFLEILRAVQIEILYSKKEILEMYLNYLPYGGNIEGVKAASYIYFNRPPNKLSLSQAIVLTIIPNDPNNLRIDRDITLLELQRKKWIEKFGELKLFSEQNLKDALNEPVKSNRFEIPKLAPHFSNRLSRTYNETIFFSTLELDKQTISENLLSNYLRKTHNQDISNGAILIVDNINNNVVAYCGSGNFFDAASEGQVDGITSLRSPGSTLKPFLYAQAFDKGFLTPQMKLLDIPMEFSGYEPENYDKKFNGEVSAEFALINSLNIPAVHLLQKINIEAFLHLLSEAGFDKINEDKDKLGLSLILGGCGTKLEEIVRAYTSFSNKGGMRKLNFKKDGLNKKSVKLFSEESAYLITKILSKSERPDFPSSFIGESKLPLIAWKTGTSYGKRDAWAVGMNPRYTIGVWLGNFDGHGSPYLSGAEIAVPLLFDLFNSIDYNANKNWYELPQNLLERKVCAVTGLLPSDNCSETNYDFYIKNVSTHKKCDRYKNFMVNEKKTMVYCPDCLNNKKYQIVAYPDLDPELKLFLVKNNLTIEEPPPHNPDCRHIISKEGPEIISPLPGYEYFVDRNGDQEILLKAVSPEHVKYQFWYINDTFYKKCEPGDNVFFFPEDEIVRIACADNKGGTSQLSIKVNFY